MGNSSIGRVENREVFSTKGMATVDKKSVVHPTNWRRLAEH